MAKRKIRFYASSRSDSSQNESLSDNPGALETHQNDPITTTCTTKEEVLEIVHANVTHKTIVAPGRPAPELPCFDDLELYDVTKEQASLLWECEVQRLLAVVQNLDQRLDFAEDALFPEPDTAASYEILSQMADQILVNLHICRHDNETLFQQHAADQARIWALDNSKSILEDQLDDSKDDFPTEDIHSRRFISRYCAVVDYMTAVVARFAIAAADHSLWHARALSGLAKTAAKLKVLCRDPEGYASRSLEVGRRQHAERIILQALGATKDDQATGANQQDGNAAPTVKVGMGKTGGDNRFSVHPMHMHTARQQKELESFLHRGEGTGDTYFKGMAQMNNWTSSTLLEMVQELKASRVSGHTIDGLDVCSLVYKAGTPGSSLFVSMYQDRHGEIFGSSRENTVKHSYQGYKLFRDVVEGLKEKARLEEKKVPARASTSSRSSIDHDHDRHRPSGTRIIAQLHTDMENDPVFKPTEVVLSSLGEVIAAMIPLTCTLPPILSELQTAVLALGEVYPIDLEEEMRPRAPAYTAVACLRTKSFEAQSSSCLPGSDFRSLSRSIVSQTHRHSALSKGPTTSNAWDGAAPELVKQRQQEARRRQEKLAAEADEWVIEETTIRVDCSRYVYTVLGVCGFLVVGGLMLGVFLGTVQNIDGTTIALNNVDPFGFTTYSWVVAGFILLVAKSVRVNEWPWRDFLLRRVTCRSLSELAAVTGADPQDLLVYLLTREADNVLLARGPYNKFFTRLGLGGPGNGFSIDVKPEVRSLVAAGLVFVKVSSSGGNSLVCLDLRAGGDLRDARTSIRHFQNMTEKDYVCQYPPRAGDKTRDLEITQWKNFSHLRWRKVLGIYHSYERKIR